MITIDTELSPRLHQRGVDSRANVASSIFGQCEAGTFGIGWQMEQMTRHGVKGVLFIDPLPSLVYGESWLADVVGPVIENGHEVQLHIHTEWLAWAKQSPVAGRKGQNLADFSYDDQLALLGAASNMLVRAGAPQPTAFRAGNYGADDNSLRALAALGLTWDSSVNAPYLGASCRIAMSPDQTAATARHGIIELPVSGIEETGGQIRPAQVCALSTREMQTALIHAADFGHRAFVIVTHSFEMLSRDRERPNRMVMARFSALCETIARHRLLSSARFADLDPVAVMRTGAAPQARLRSSRTRTWARMAEQAVATWRYERQLGWV